MIECPTCKRLLSGMDVHHGRLAWHGGEAYVRRSIAWCPSCNVGLEHFEYFQRTKAALIELREPGQVDQVKQELGLTEPAVADLANGEGGV